MELNEYDKIISLLENDDKETKELGQALCKKYLDSNDYIAQALLEEPYKESKKTDWHKSLVDNMSSYQHSYNLSMNQIMELYKNTGIIVKDPTRSLNVIDPNEKS